MHFVEEANVVVEKKGLGMPIFKGFMVDGA
jgi:hypothetical protein